MRHALRQHDDALDFVVLRFGLIHRQAAVVLHFSQHFGRHGHFLRLCRAAALKQFDLQRYQALGQQVGRDGAQIQHLTGVQRAEAINEIAQLAHIAGPGVVDQRV